MSISSQLHCRNSCFLLAALGVKNIRFLKRKRSFAKIFEINSCFQYSLRRSIRLANVDWVKLKIITDIVRHLLADLMSTDKRVSTYHELESKQSFHIIVAHWKTSKSLFHQEKGTCILKIPTHSSKPSRSNNTGCFTFTFTKLRLCYCKTHAYMFSCKGNIDH